MDLSAINFNDLKSACKSLNDSGLLKKKIKLIGLKKGKLVETFVAEVEKLDDQGLVDDLPEDVFEFYNSLSEAEEEEVEEEDEDEEIEDDEDEDEEEEDDEDEDEDEDEEDEPTPPKKKRKPAAKKKAPAKKKKAPPKETRERIATVRMSCKVDGDKFRIKFADGSKGKVFKMPEKKNQKDKLKLVIKKAADFAKEKGATDGQVKAVRKAFTRAGWHVTK